MTDVIFVTQRWETPLDLRGDFVGSWRDLMMKFINDDFRSVSVIHQPSGVHVAGAVRGSDGVTMWWKDVTSS